MGFPFTADIGHVDVLRQSSGCANLRFLVSKLIDRSDNNSAMFAPALGAWLSPSVFPDVVPTPAARTIVICRRRHNLGTKTRCVRQ
jgi:hypothetical protein